MPLNMIYNPAVTSAPNARQQPQGAPDQGFYMRQQQQTQQQDGYSGGGASRAAGGPSAPRYMNGARQRAAPAYPASQQTQDAQSMLLTQGNAVAGGASQASGMLSQGAN